LAALQRNVKTGWRQRLRICTKHCILRVSPYPLHTIYIPPLSFPPLVHSTNSSRLGPPNLTLSYESVRLTPRTEAVAATLSTLSIEAQAKAEKDSAKKAAKAAKAEQAEADKKAASKIILKRVERTKRKHVIVVSGLEAFGLDLKKVAKEMGKKFACGSSVTKAPGGGEEIVVQGDLSDEIEEWLVEKYKDIPKDNLEKVCSFVHCPPRGGF